MKNSRPKVLDGEDFSINLQYFVYTILLIAVLIFVYWDNINSFGFNWLDLALVISIFTPSMKFDDFYYYDDATGANRLLASRIMWVVMLVVSTIALSSLYESQTLLFQAPIAGITISIFCILSTYQSKLFKLRLYRMAEVDEAIMLRNEGENHTTRMKLLSIVISLVFAIVMAILYRLIAPTFDPNQEFARNILNLIAILFLGIFIIVNELFLKHRFGFVKLN